MPFFRGFARRLGERSENFNQYVLAAQAEGRQAFDPMALPGGYPNLLAGDDSDRVAKSYGPNAGRLIRAKRHYDPDNVFCSAIPLPVSQSTMAGVTASP